MTIVSHAVSPEDFSDFEWHRLNNIASRYESELKTAHIKTVVQGNPNNSEYIKGVISTTVAETAVRTARTYGLNFDPHSSAYSDLADKMTEHYMGVLNSDEAKEKVKGIIPKGIPLADRYRRLNVFGLSGRDAIRIERMRQEGASKFDIENSRLHLSVQRGNIISLTEINRVINATLETVWLENREISKAKSDLRYRGTWYLEADGVVNPITSLRGVPKRARKKIVTRRDNRTCDYCQPLDGITAKIGANFKTRYGYAPYPPFHPRCRCFMIVSF